MVIFKDEVEQASQLYRAYGITSELLIEFSERLNERIELFFEEPSNMAKKTKSDGLRHDGWCCLLAAVRRAKLSVRRRTNCDHIALPNDGTLDLHIAHCDSDLLHISLGVESKKLNDAATNLCFEGMDCRDEEANGCLFLAIQTNDHRFFKLWLVDVKGKHRKDGLVVRQRHLLATYSMVRPV